jgi:hypothetical protein
MANVTEKTGFKLIEPDSNPNSIVVIFSHGKAGEPSIEARTMNLKYYVPHGRTVEEGNIDLGLLPAEDGPADKDGKWYQYELTPIEQAQTDEELVNLAIWADEYKMAVALVTGRTYTGNVLNDLSNFSEVRGLHCR